MNLDDALYALVVVLVELFVVYASFKLGTWYERYVISSRLRQLPLDQEAFESMLDSLKLEPNPLDHRSRGAE